MDDIFNIHDSESENDSFDEEESKLSLLKSKKINNDSDEDKSKDENDENEEDNDDNENENDDSEIEDEDGDEDENEDEDDNESNKIQKDLSNKIDNRFDMSGFDDDDDNKEGELNEKRKEEKEKDKKQKKIKKPLSERKLKKFNTEHNKTGVVYLSKIPPFMKPIKLRHLLSRYAKIGKIYLAAEDEKIAHRRKKYGGNRKRNYTEGWVEFLDKREAKLVVKHLNNHIIGGKKSSWYHDDIWNMKYLHGFKWIHLTERIAYEKAVRAQKLKAEMSQASRESNVILRNVEKAKMIESMEKRKLEKIKDNEEELESTTSKKKIKTNDTTSTSNNNDSFQNPETLKIIRKYKQRKPVNPEKKTAIINPKQKSVLSKIFN
ncbi:hypothetical protein BCR32DRAFT_324422 [Anaeromyces robustus]|uniref:18S rRNA factor 2 n=1 Tax=Anaeromyces robustus TaxID=1754192 RepID=A0A1Y1XPE7_9FUNG|nr:hypothetical protein BCR32DRAFT_324422 [Anaeromyces robustus]|eukprot:ORX87612.1 hypothetical protein BCR32DRAFT_324422 [Anaeromyces robustus]